MKLEINKLKYHREKEKIDLDHPQVLVMVGDIIRAALANNGIECEVELVE